MKRRLCVIPELWVRQGYWLIHLLLWGDNQHEHTTKKDERHKTAMRTCPRIPRSPLPVCSPEKQNYSFSFVKVLFSRATMLVKEKEQLTLAWWDRRPVLWYKNWVFEEYDSGMHCHGILFYKKNCLNRSKPIGSQTTDQSDHGEIKVLLPTGW